MFVVGRWELFVARAYIGGPWYRTLHDVQPELYDLWFVIGDNQFRRRVK